LKKIYSNLGKVKEFGFEQPLWAVTGPNSRGGYTDFVGLPFTPKSNSHASQVQVPMGYLSGANQVNLNIYGDTGGVPGILLAGPVTVTNLPTYPRWGFAVADFTPVALTAGTQYWVVADTPLSGTGSDFFGWWSSVDKTILMAWDLGVMYGGWEEINADSLAAGEVLGTIP